MANVMLLRGIGCCFQMMYTAFETHNLWVPPLGPASFHECQPWSFPLPLPGPGVGMWTAAAMIAFHANADGQQPCDLTSLHYNPACCDMHCVLSGIHAALHVAGDIAVSGSFGNGSFFSASCLNCTEM